MIQSIIQGSKAGTIKSCRERQTCEWFSPNLGFSPAKVDDFTTKIGIQQLIWRTESWIKKWIWVCPQIRDRPLIPGISMVMGRRWILGHRYEHHGLISSFYSTTSQAEIVFFSGNRWEFCYRVFWPGNSQELPKTHVCFAPFTPVFHWPTQIRARLKLFLA